MTGRIGRGFALALALLLACAGPSLAQTQAGVSVSAAASLKNALDEIDAAFAKAKGGAPVTANFAASSLLARQIEQGAPADVFVSADADWMDYLAQRKLIRSETRRDLLTNRLALIAAKDSAVKLTLKPKAPLAAALNGGRLAMAGPDVPAGRYGQAALTSLGLWDQVKDRTALGENVRAALQFVARGEAPLGVVYDTDAMVEPKVRIVGLFPAASHPRIVYPVAVLSGSRSPAAAAYVRYLSSPAAAAVFKRYGFTVLAR